MITLSFYIISAIIFCSCFQCGAHLFGNQDLGIASYRHDYDNTNKQVKLEEGKTSEFRIHRFQSPESIKNAFDTVRKRSSFKWCNSKDKRKGWVSCTKVSFESQCHDQADIFTTYYSNTFTHHN